MRFLSIAVIPFLVVSSAFANYKMQGPPPPVAKTVTEVALKETEKPKERTIVCEGCNSNEQVAVAFLNDHGITDKNAMATVLGNIRQESTFHPNICEGGARVSYQNCHYGGFGLIQWTSTGRYRGLGDFAYRHGGNPSTLGTQLRYMVNEVQWKRIEERMKTPGLSIESYMNYAYSWLGWGHHGARTHYAYDYARKLKVVYI